MPDVTYYSDEHYLDLFSAQADQTDQAVRLLAEFAGRRQALELGGHLIVEGYVPRPKHYMHLRELDLEAADRGLRLVHRWGGWAKEPYRDGSTHISVYQAGDDA